MAALTSVGVVGIDLAGPTNARDTAVAACAIDGDGLRCLHLATGFDDAALLEAIDTWSEAPVVGLDAPLSYQPGGGDRDAERALRAFVRGRLPGGTVMAPTMTRMAYLSLRGLAVARLILARRPRARIVEVHPAAHLVGSGASVDDVRALKPDPAARARLVRWLGTNGLADVPARGFDDHEVAALAAARAAWAWARGHSHCLTPARPPLHPFDVSC